MNYLRSIAAALLLALLPLAAVAQTSPNLTKGQVLTAGQWNALFAGKQDTLGYTPLNSAGGSMTGRLVTAAASASVAGFNLPPGATPASPINGDLWTTSSGIFVQIAGSTLALSTSGAGSFAGTSPITVSFPSSIVTYACATCGVTTNPLSQFAATTSAQLRGVISDETGTGGSAVFATAPTMSAVTLTGLTNTAQLVVTSNSSFGLAVGAGGSVNSAFTVDASTVSQAAGVRVIGAVTGGTVAIGLTDPATNTNISIDAKGSGTVSINGTATGAIVLNRATTLSGALTYGGVTLSNAVTGTGNMVLSSSPSISAPTITGALTYGGVALSASVTGTGSMVLSAAPTITGALNTQQHIITSTSALAFVVGPLGTSNPTLTVDASAGSAQTGLNIKSATSGGGLALSTTSSGTNENLKFDAKGSGTVSINTVATGAIILGQATTISGALTYAGVTLNNVVTGTGNMVLSTSPTISGTFTSNAHSIVSSLATALAVGSNGATNPAFVVDASTASQVAGLSVKGAATGGTVALAAIDSGANTGLSINTKGTGTLTLNNVGTGGIVVGSPTGGDKGAGTINISGSAFYVNGTAVTGTVTCGTIAIVGTGTCNFPYFSAYLSANITGIVATTPTNINADVETADSNSWYVNSGTFRFTPLLAGKYEINIQITAQGTGLTEIDCDIQFNGSKLVEGLLTISGPTTQTCTVKKVVAFNGTTDFAQAFGIPFGTGPFTFIGGNAPYRTYFEAKYVGP